MHNFNIIKKGITFFMFFAATSYEVFAQQDQDSTKSSLDTTSVAISQTNRKGEKLSGIIVDGNTKKPLGGARISIVDFSATIADEKGQFTITIPSYKSTVQITAEGYHSKLVPVFKNKPLNVILYPQSFPSLFETANLPLGPKSLSRTTASVVTENSNDILSADSETPTSFFQGRLAGVNSIRRSSTPGVGSDLFLRGFTSLKANNSPLYVVDGMIYDAASYGNSLTSGFRSNPLSFIDLKDIASVTVIKDAAQAAVYGTRASNGVIIIKTNTADELTTKIDFTAYGGVNTAPSAYPVMNSDNYRPYLIDVMKSGGLTNAQIATLTYINDDRKTNDNYFAARNESGLLNTNWQKQVFRTGIDQNYYLRITGGDNVAKYALSVGLLKDNSVTDSTDYQRYNTRFNADLNLTPKLTGTASLSFTYALQNLKPQGYSPSTNPIFLALVKSPFFQPNSVSTDGKVSPNLADVDSLQIGNTGGIGNPRAIIENSLNRNKSYRFFGSTDFHYSFSKSFKLSTLVGLTYDKAQESMFIPRLGVADTVREFRSVLSRSGTQTVRFFGVYNDTRLAYNKVIKDTHRISALLGARYYDNQSEQDFGTGINTATDQLLSIGNTDPGFRSFGGDLGRWRTLNTYLTADYSFLDKYLINATVAVDGSSRFGRQGNNGIRINGNKLAVLPAIGAAWIMSSEEFMSDVKSVDLLKLRASYGVVGNDDIGNYSARRTYTSQNLLNYQGLVVTNIANPYLSWEKVEKFNLGVDAALFSERLSLSLDFWNHNSMDLVTEQSIDVVSVGKSYYLSNNTAMRTKGFDFGLNARIINTGFKWDAGLTLGKYTNEVTKMGSGGPVYTSFINGTYITQIGQEANLFYGYRTNGVFSSAADAAAVPHYIRTSSGALIPFTAGDMRFVNVNSTQAERDAGIVVIDADDRVVIGNPNPDFFGSFTNTLGYKRFKLDALFTFVYGNDVYNYTRSQLESGSDVYNQTNALINRWKFDGQVTNTPKVSYQDPMGNSRFSDRWIEDGSYLRLRTLALTYNVPLKTTAIKSANVYATANNVFTLSKYLGYDPEFSSGSSIFRQGVDTTNEPQFKSFQLGIRIGL